MVADTLNRREPAIVAGMMACEWHLLEAFSHLTMSVAPGEMVHLSRAYDCSWIWWTEYGRLSWEIDERNCG